MSMLKFQKTVEVGDREDKTIGECRKKRDAALGKQHTWNTLSAEASVRVAYLDERTVKLTAKVKFAKQANCHSYAWTMES